MISASGSKRYVSFLILALVAVVASTILALFLWRGEFGFYGDTHIRHTGLYVPGVQNRLYDDVVRFQSGVDITMDYRFSDEQTTRSAFSGEWAIGIPWSTGATLDKSLVLRIKKVEIFAAINSASSAYKKALQDLVDLFGKPKRLNIADTTISDINVWIDGDAILVLVLDRNHSGSIAYDLFDRRLERIFPSATPSRYRLACEYGLCKDE